MSTMNKPIDDCCVDDCCEHEHYAFEDIGCSCCDHDSEHSHDEEEGLGKLLWVGAILYALTLAVHLLVPARFYFQTFGASGAYFMERLVIPVLFLLAFVLIGKNVLYYSVSNILKGKVFDENFLMAVAGIGAFCIGEYPEAVAVMLFYNIGEYLQGRAVSGSKRSIKSLLDIRPDTALLLDSDGNIPNEVAADSVKIGDLILLRPGDRVPLDGSVVSGSSELDYAALTGESVPRSSVVGDEVCAGAINLSGTLTLKVAKLFGESTASRIIDLGANASARKAKAEEFITKFARVYTPIVCGLAVLIAVLPALFGFGDFKDWLYRGLVFLVVSCPCALVISIPLGFFCGIGGASSRGIMVKGGNYLEALASVDAVVFDKTGTLTEGKFTVTDIKPMDGVSEEELLRLAATAEQSSTHPIAVSIVAAYNAKFGDGKLAQSIGDIPPSLRCVPNVLAPAEVTEKAGLGVIAEGDGLRIFAGKKELLVEEGHGSWDYAQDDTDYRSTQDDTDYRTYDDTDYCARGDYACHSGRSEAESQNPIDLDSSAGAVYVGIERDGVYKYLGRILVADTPKVDSADTVSGLHSRGVDHVVMLSGDVADVAERVGFELGIDDIRAGLMPWEKVEAIEELIEERDGPRVKRGDGGKRGTGDDGQHDGDNYVYEDSLMKQASPHSMRGPRKHNKLSTVVFVGDGINDAPVLARADVGIAMGGLGSDAAIEAADIILMNDKPSALLTAIDIARKTRKIVSQNVVFALGIKVAVLALAALGIANMWEAVFADVGVALLAAINATRAGRIKS
jgi:Cd2+/Zn2+-exporting ATPase